MRTIREFDHKVNLPVGGDPNGLHIAHHVIEPDSLENLRESFRGRGTKPGTYTLLVDGGTMWMSDTDAEWRDHLDAVWRIRNEACERVLINGLGIGMVLKAALFEDHVKHVDVVEINQQVIDLVGPHYDDPRVTIHHADAYSIKWPTGTRWDVAWHDIWPDMNEDNLPLMAKLHRSYGGRVRWQGSWSKEYLLNERRRDANAPWR